jgi:hypothetical protein
VHNNSWEFSGNNNYTAVSRQVDEFAFVNPEDIVVFAAGNSEADLNWNGILDANTLGENAVAKNILCVGASENVTPARRVLPDVPHVLWRALHQRGVQGRCRRAVGRGRFPDVR